MSNSEPTNDGIQTHELGETDIIRLSRIEDLAYRASAIGQALHSLFWESPPERGDRIAGIIPTLGILLDEIGTEIAGHMEAIGSFNSGMTAVEEFGHFWNKSFPLTGPDYTVKSRSRMRGPTREEGMKPYP